MCLTETLGGKSLKERMRDTDTEEFNLWRAKWRIEPPEIIRADMRAASVVQMLANVNRDQKQQKEPFGLSEFLLKFIPRSKQLEEQETQTKQTHVVTSIKAVADRLGLQIKKNKK